MEVPTCAPLYMRHVLGTITNRFWVGNPNDVGATHRKITNRTWEVP